MQLGSWGAVIPLFEAGPGIFTAQNAIDWPIIYSLST